MSGPQAALGSRRRHLRFTGRGDDSLPLALTAVPSSASHAPFQGAAEWRGPGSRAESEGQRSLSPEQEEVKGKKRSPRARAVRAPRWYPGGAGERDGGSAWGTMEARGEGALNALPTSTGPTCQDRPEAKIRSGEACHSRCLSPGSSRQLPGVSLSQGFPGVETILPGPQLVQAQI